MMRGKSPQFELILEIIKSNNSLIFLKKLKREILCCLISSTYILIIREKFDKIRLFISLTFKFAIFTHHCNLRAKFYNEIYKSFARVHNLKISFYNCHKSKSEHVFAEYFVCLLNCILFV